MNSEEVFEDEEESYDEYEDSPKSVPAIRAKAAIGDWNKLSLKVNHSTNEDGSQMTHLKATKSAFVSALIHLDGQRFSFKGREYLEPVYNRSDSEILLKTARQVEKTVVISSTCLMANGELKKAGDINIENDVAALDVKTQKIVSGKVIWKSKIYQKSCLRIKTRQGHEIEIATTHPIRLWESWVEAGKLSVGNKVACVRKAGEFGDLRKRDCMVELTAFMIGDGYCPLIGEFSFTQNPGAVLEQFIKCLKNEAVSFRIRPRKTKSAIDICYKSPGFLEELAGRNSYTHEIPSWVFSLNRRQAALFLNRLWACDGCLKQRTSTMYDFVYASMSKKLVRGVQSLLWKFGIPSAIRENLPSIYKKKGETSKVAYLLRIETAQGVDTFLREIGALDKSEGIPLPDLENCNNNRDTFPYELSELVGIIYETDGIKDKRGTDKKALMQEGLRKKPEYCLTKDKAKRYLEFFKEGYDKKLVTQLCNHIESDIYWDTIVSIEDTGLQECIDFEVENYHNFIVDGVITHNSTFLSNNLVISSAVIPYNKSLYVSPSHMQTRQFSSEKLKPILDRSPLIRTYLQDSSVSQQVFEKGFLNGSFIFLRSAFRSADRARGISASTLTLDEIQDMLIDQIPVIRECTSHFPNSSTYFAGTPKSLSNPIEVYWKTTSQNEWLVPCPHCNKWNFLDEKNIAPTAWYLSERLPPGPVCKYCEKPIDVTKGRWVSMSPDKLMKGYRIPQLMVPWICGIAKQWVKLLWKRDNYPLSQFYNEVLGISYDTASAPITQEELVRICGEHSMLDLDRLTSDQINRGRGLLLTAGVDWGEGLDGSEKSPSGKLRPASYTVLTIGYYHTRDQYKVIAIKKFTGKETDPDYVVAFIAKVCKTLGICLVGVDWGHGWGVNNQLVRLLGGDHVVQFQYLPKLKMKMKWDSIGYRYHLMRNFMMSELYYDMKKENILFPTWSEFEPYSKDILAIYTEYSEFKKEMKYDHRIADPDDFFHSLLFAKLVADIQLGRANRFTQGTTGTYAD
jgi:intein/homing endonuclease